MLKALGFTRDTLIYVASGELYGGERRLAILREAFPKIVSSISIVKAFYMKLYFYIYDFLVSNNR